MSDNKSTEIKLLELFDILSKSFYNLSSTYEKLKSDLESVSRCGQNIIDTRQLVNQIDKDLQIVKQNCSNIEKISFELQAYQTNFLNIPGQVFDHLHSISNNLTNIMEELKRHDGKTADAVKKLIDTFDDEFLDAVKKIKELGIIIQQLEPITKFSILINKPLSLIILFVTITIAVGGFILMVWETKTKIEKATITTLEQVAIEYQKQKN
jgi:hypothetical protein